MRKIYSFMLTTLLVFLASFEANAALTTTITWDEPGSVEIYVGGTGAANKVVIPEGATSYVATIDNTWGTTYVGAAPGYALKNGVCLENGDNLNVVSYSKKININMSAYDGKTIKINAGKIEYDAEFEINVINGRGKINCWLDGTSRNIDLKTGVNTIPYSTEFEPKVFFEADFEGSEDYYLKQDGVEMTWTNFYGKIKNNSGFTLSPNTKFEIKYCNTDDEPEVVVAKPVVTLSYENAMAKSALGMIFNVTANKTISHDALESFEVEEGDVVRFTLNTKDYDVTFNGEALAASTEDYTLKEVTVTEDVTLTISATERVYPETDLYFYASDIEGLVIQDADLKDIDPSKIAATGMTTSYTFTLPGEDKQTKSATVKQYKVTVSLKNPKAFVGAAEGWWIEASQSGSGEDLAESTMISSDKTLYVLNHKIEKDKKLVVYLGLLVGGDVKAENVSLKDNQGNKYALTKGYNYFDIDASYSSKFTAALLTESETAPTFSYYCNGSQILPSGDAEQYIATIDGDALLHIFAERPATPITVTANITADAEGAKVEVDHFTTLTASGEVATFSGCDVEVTPGENKYLLNGEAPEYEGDTHAFTASASRNSITIGDVAKMVVTPAADEEMDINDFKCLIVSFPNAATAIVNGELAADEYNFRKSDWSWAADGVTVTAVEGAKAPTFKITPDPMPTVGGTYQYVIPAGAFTINGTIASEEAFGSITLTQTLTTKDLDIFYSPMEDEINLADFYGMVNVMYIIGKVPADLEDFDPSEYMCDMEIVEEKAAGIVVKFNDEELVMGDENGYQIDAEIGNVVSIGVAPKAGKLYVSIPAGAFTIMGADVPAFEHTWTIVDTSGINSASAAANGKASVVALDGRVVLSNASASDVKALPRGCYIINGKKMVK